MGELYDDRRQEPRFNAGGIYRLQAGSGGSGHIYDLSLNGAMLERRDDIIMEAETRTVIVLSIADQPEFVADVLIKHVTPERIGIEFYDMSPEHFTTLTSLIERFQRSNATPPLRT
jgi:hypothetical protein